MAMNKNETKLFLGAQDGNIYELLVSSLSLSMMHSHPDSDETRRPLLTGHKDRVTHLSISMDGSLLISGSLDSTCKVWDIYQSKLIRDVKHQAPIANLVTTIVPEAFALTSMTQSQNKPPFLAKQLRRNLYKMPRDICISQDDIFDESTTTLYFIKNKYDVYPKVSSSVSEVSTKADLGPRESDLENPSLVNDLKEKLKQMYVLSTEKIFKEAASESLRPIKRVKKVK